MALVPASSVSVSASRLVKLDKQRTLCNSSRLLTEISDKREYCRLGEAENVETSNGVNIYILDDGEVRGRREKRC